MCWPPSRSPGARIQPCPLLHRSSVQPSNHICIPSVQSFSSGNIFLVLSKDVFFSLLPPSIPHLFHFSLRYHSQPGPSFSLNHTHMILKIEDILEIMSNSTLKNSISNSAAPDHTLYPNYSIVKIPIHQRSS